MNGCVSEREKAREREKESKREREIKRKREGEKEKETERVLEELVLTLKAVSVFNYLTFLSTF